MAQYLSLSLGIKFTYFSEDVLLLIFFFFFHVISEQ